LFFIIAVYAMQPFLANKDEYILSPIVLYNSQ